VGNGTAGADNGNVFGIYNYRDRDRDQTFTYDSLNRLTSAQNEGTDCTAMVLQNKTEYWGNSYGYDAWGNMLSKAITKCGAENLLVTADAHNWIHATGAPDYQYDAAGNMTYDAAASLNYFFDQENRLTGADGYTYTYDGDGNRVRKSNGNLAANGTLYWAMTPGVVAETDLAGTLKSEYVFFDGERVARKDFPSNAIAYYFADNLKTASVITDAAGNITAESDYYPWGGELQFTNNDSNHYKFAGKERDETGLDYFGARYYSNELGRWVSADWSATPVPVPYADFGDPQSLNLYGYVRGLPTTKADADGHGWWDKFKNKMGEAGCWCEGETAEKAKIDKREQGEENALAAQAFFNDPQNQRTTIMVVLAIISESLPSGSGSATSEEVSEEGSATNLSKADQLRVNQASGKAFEKSVVQATKSTDTKVVEQVTLKTESGAKTRMDVVSTDVSGNVRLQEAKGSATAPLTPSQAVAHPEIEQTGATVVGKGKSGYPGGTKIPPTKVEIVRPKE
jgi:RHS repeat-associated protein